LGIPIASCERRILDFAFDFRLFGTATFLLLFQIVKIKIVLSKNDTIYVNAFLLHRIISARFQ
jgi:hypothetical protein